MFFAYLLFATAISLSSIAAFYSISGLISIFAAAPIPVMIMGAALEAAKLVSTVFLHNNWHHLKVGFRSYLVFAISILMLITSLGIFGLLSKAHVSQRLDSANISTQLESMESRLAILRQSIDSDRRSIAQLDSAVDQLIQRSNNVQGVNRSVNIRRSQAEERTRLNSHLTLSLKELNDLTSEMSILKSKAGKVESEVGPIRYLAKLIYGAQGADEDQLERAVTWIIIMIVSVFDPLALTLLLAANKQLEWQRLTNLVSNEPVITVPEVEKSQTVTDIKVVDQVDNGNCPDCNNKLEYIPGLGLYCPNDQCQVYVTEDLDQENLVEVPQPTDETAHNPIDDASIPVHSQKEAVPAIGRKVMYSQQSSPYGRR
jgi:hypothetical protein